MSKTIVTLGGQQFEVIELPLRKNREWRTSASAGPVQAFRTLGKQPDEQLEIGELHTRFNEALSEQGDAVLDLVLDYLQLDGEQREQVSDRVTEEEILRAFLAINRVAFHTNFFLELAAGPSMNGSVAPATGKTSPEASGDVLPTSWTP